MILCHNRTEGGGMKRLPQIISMCSECPYYRDNGRQVVHCEHWMGKYLYPISEDIPDGCPLEDAQKEGYDTISNV
jgi:hypothetical protein